MAEDSIIISFVMFIGLSLIVCRYFCEIFFCYLFIFSAAVICISN